jgi:hypothetical protein
MEVQSDERDDLMTVTILYDDAPAVDAEARVDGDQLWVSPEDFQAAAGWTLKPEGLCREQACVPPPKGRVLERSGGAP